MQSTVTMLRLFRIILLMIITQTYNLKKKKKKENKNTPNTMRSRSSGSLYILFIRKQQFPNGLSFVTNGSLFSASQQFLALNQLSKQLMNYTNIGNYYVDLALPMGCLSSCQLLESISSALEWIAQAKLGIALVT